MSQITRLSDVAKAAGVSQGTASNVFNRPEIVRKEVRERVEAAALALGYSGPDPKGRLLRAGKVNAIGVVLAHELTYFFEDPFARRFMAGVAEVCDEHGAGIALVSADARDEAAWTIQSALVDGFILYCLDRGDTLLKMTQKRGIPFVAVDPGESRPGVRSIEIDDHHGAYLAGRHVAALGHRRVGILSLEIWDESTGPVAPGDYADASYPLTRRRIEGYLDALAEVGIDRASVPIYETFNDEETSRAAVDYFLSLPEPPTALLVMADAAALFAMAALKERGLRLPEDMTIVGFDDIPEAALADPPLTTIAQPIREKGRRAARMVLEPDDGTTHLELPLSLIDRKSSSRPGMKAG